MIADSEITAVGRVVKTHGTAGELNVELYNPDVMEPRKGSCLIFNIDGINVPFFVKASRQRGGDRVLVTFDDIDSDVAASQLSGKEVYALNGDLDIDNEDEGFFTLEDMVGYNLHDTDGTLVGEITDIDDSTENVLFEVKRTDGAMVFVPAANELVTDIDPAAKTLTMNLPTGLY